MNKVINISLAGQVFSLEEPAYSRLTEYLEQLKNRIGAEEQQEVLEDIETRIAEHLKSQLGTDPTKAAAESDIKEILTIMGDPEEIVPEEKEEEARSEEPKLEGPSGNWLYRDTRNKLIAGICSGLALRFNIDPLWIRLLFIIFALPLTTVINDMLLITNLPLGILAYIILWIAVPKPSNADHVEYLNQQSQKLREKSIFRDPENRLIGGVGGGLASHLRIDPLFFRLLFLATIFIYGIGLLLYIILWIIIPEPTNNRELVILKRRRSSAYVRRPLSSPSSEELEREGKEPQALSSPSRFKGWTLVILGALLVIAPMIAYISAMVSLVHDFTSMRSLMMMFSGTGIMLACIMLGSWLIEKGLANLNQRPPLALEKTHAFWIFLGGGVFLIVLGMTGLGGDMGYAHNFPHQVKEGTPDKTVHLKSEPYERWAVDPGKPAVIENFLTSIRDQNTFTLEIIPDGEKDTVSIMESLQARVWGGPNVGTGDFAPLEPLIEDTSVTFKTNLPYWKTPNHSGRIMDVDFTVHLPERQKVRIDSSLHHFNQVHLQARRIDPKKYHNTTWQNEEGEIKCLNC